MCNKKIKYEYDSTAKHPIKSWTKGIGIENSARQQLHNIANLPFIHKHVAVMPDVHWGKGATIGSVIATKGAVVPAAVGVDLGCGMNAVKTTLFAKDLPDNLSALRHAIEAVIPHGRSHNGGKDDKGGFKELPLNHMLRWKALEDRYKKIIASNGEDLE